MLSVQFNHVLCVCVLSHLSHVRLFATPPACSPWESPGKNTGEGCHFLLLGIFPIQRLNPGLLHLLQGHLGSLPLVPLGKPISHVRYIHILCNQIPEHFSSVSAESLFLLNNNSFFFLFRFLAITILLSVSVNLMTLEPSLKWNHTIVLKCSHTYFTEYDICKVHPSCVRIPFLSSTVSGHLGCFHVLIIVKNAAMTMGVLSALLGISSQVELLDHKFLRFLSACDGEKCSHIEYFQWESHLAYTWFILNCM